MHESACFIELYDYMKECSISNLIDMEEFNKLLQKQIKLRNFSDKFYLWRC